MGLWSASQAFMLCWAKFCSAELGFVVSGWVGLGILSYVQLSYVLVGYVQLC